MKLFFCLLICSTTAMALTNSVAAEDDLFQAVAMISTTARDPQDGSTLDSYCNASFIHPQVLISAAHCVRDAFLLKDFHISIELGKYKYVTKPDGSKVRVGYAPFLKEKKTAHFLFTKVLTDKINRLGFRTQIEPYEDFAIIVLTNPLSQTPPLVEVIAQTEFQGLKQIVNQYMPTVVSVNFIAHMTTNDTKRIGQLNQLGWTGNHFKSTSSVAVEEGDSGAPLFARIGKIWKLIGVVKGRAKTYFSEWDVFSPADQKLCEIGQSSLIPQDAKKLICYNN